MQNIYTYRHSLLRILYYNMSTSPAPIPAAPQNDVEDTIEIIRTRLKFFGNVVTQLTDMAERGLTPDTVEVVTMLSDLLNSHQLTINIHLDIVEKEVWGLKKELEELVDEYERVQIELKKWKDDDEQLKRIFVF